MDNDDVDAVDVLICGGGATGLTLALELARRRIAFRIVDRLAAPFPGSRGKGLQPRTLEIFDDLGVLHRVLERGGAYPPKRAYAPDGSFVDSALVAPRAPTPAEPHGMPLIVPQFATEDVLRARLRELGHAIEFGIALERLEQDADKVTAGLCGPAGPCTVSARYVVGADGGRSTVRHLLGIDFPGEMLDGRAIVADVQLGGLARDAWHMFNEASPDLLALCPLPGTDLFSLMAPLPCEAGPDLSATTPASLIGALVRARSGRQDIVVGAVRWASTFRMGARLAARYRGGRVFLAGDAAHVHPPAGAQGLNTSVQDAYNLGWKLAAALAPDNATIADRLLDSYETERRPVGAAMLTLATRLLHAAQRGDLRRDRTVRQLDLAYRASPLALDMPPGPQSGRPGVAAGDRAPDAPLSTRAGQPTRLFALFAGPHWTLLGRDVARARLAGLERAGLHIHLFGDAGDLVDDAGHVADAYALGRGDVVLVRPDGHVGARVATGTPGAWHALAAYLRQVGLGGAPGQP